MHAYYGSPLNDGHLASTVTVTSASFPVLAYPRQPSRYFMLQVMQQQKTLNCKIEAGKLHPSFKAIFYMLIYQMSDVRSK